MLLFLTAGCAAPVSYMNYVRMSYDATQMVQEEPTTGDRMLSLMTAMECQAMNLLKAKDICIEKGEAPDGGARHLSK